MGFGVSPINAPSNEPGILGFLSALLQGVHSSNQQREQEKQQKQTFATEQGEAKQRAQLTDLDIQQKQGAIRQSQMGEAQALQQSALNRVFQDPSLVKDPMIINAITQANTMQGLPTPLNKDGSLDLSPYRKSLSGLPPKVLDDIQARDPMHRKPILDALKQQGYDIPKSMYKDTAFIDAKTEATIERNKMLGAHWIHEDSIRAASEKYRQRHTENMDTLARQRQYSTDLVNAARINSLNSTAKASLMRASAAVQESNARLSKFRMSPSGSRAPLQASLTQVLKLHNELQKQLDTAQTAYNNLINGDNPPDPGSDQAVEAMQNINDLKTQIDALGNQYFESISALQSGADISARLSSASSKHVTSVSQSRSLGRVPNGVPPGVYEVRGKKVRVEADGNYYSI